MTRYWISTPRTTIAVTVDENDVIKGVTPNTRSEICDCEIYQDCVKCDPTKFIGQSLDALLNWVRRQGQVRIMKI